MTTGDPLELGPDLGAAAGRMRDEWRADEEEWTRAAASQWTHGRRLLDIAQELMHRGDTVALKAASTTFTGAVIHVGVDYLRMQTAGGSVDVHLAAVTTGAAGRHIRLTAPVLIRVLERVRAGGRSAGAGPDSFRACLLEHETEAIEVVVGSALLDDEARGTVTVGRDHLCLRDHDGGEAYLPLAWTSWVMPWRE
jgi:hypothetical protein